MAYLTQPDVQAFLEQTKARIDTIDPVLDQDTSAYVLGSLDGQYDITTWINGDTTPSLVLSIMAMRYAGIFYSRNYSEDEQSMNGWGAWLLKECDTLLNAIISGSIGIVGVSPVQDERGPLFFPTDAQDFDNLGNETKFTMGKLF